MRIADTFPDRDAIVPRSVTLCRKHAGSQTGRRTIAARRPVDACDTGIQGAGVAAGPLTWLRKEALSK